MATIHAIPAICKRGHVIDLNAGARAKLGYCDECGQRAINACPSCSNPILGPERVADAFGTLDAQGWTPPEFYRDCGAAFPWVDRQGRIYQRARFLRWPSRADPVYNRDEVRANPCVRGSITWYSTVTAPDSTGSNC